MSSFKDWLSLLTEGHDMARKIYDAFPGFRELLGSNGIDIKKLKMIGQGDKGTAFSDGKIVVKITEDPNEARTAANLVGENLSGIARISYVGKLSKEIPYQDTYDLKPIVTQYYVIIQEKINTDLSHEEGVLADVVGDYLFKKRPPQPINVTSVLRDIIRSEQHRTKVPLASPHALGIMGELIRTFDRLRYHGIEVLDITADNLGKDASGNLRLFDLGVSHSPSVTFGIIK